MTELFTHLETVIAASSPADCPALAAELERLKFLVLTRMMQGTPVLGEAGRREQDLLTIPEVAPRLNVSVYRAYELARQGKLRTVKIGKSVRVTPSAIQEFVARLNGGKPA